MSGVEHSLLAWLDAPIVVGDPQGRAVYVNPAFEERFPRAREGAAARPLAELFEGGAREAVLRSVMGACEQGESVRFRVREGEVGYSAVASPIQVESEQVGVVILLKEEVEGTERLLALHREMQEPLEELAAVLDTLLEQTGGRRNPRHRALVEDGLRSVSRLRKWSEEVGALLAGRPAADLGSASLDAAAVLRQVVDRVQRLAEPRGVTLAVLAPGSLPEMAGDEDRLEAVLLRLLQRRVQQDPAPTRISLGARHAGKGAERALILSISEHWAGPPEAATHAIDPPVDKEAVSALGGMLYVLCHPDLGRTTTLRLPVRSA